MDIMSFLGFKRNDPVSRAIADAITHLEEKDYDLAIAVIHERALSRDPNHRRALLHLGICHMLKGEFDTAESILIPLARQAHMDSESAAAKIALDKITKDRGARE